MMLRAQAILIALVLAVSGAHAQPSPASTHAVQANQSDYCQRALGTWFYCERPTDPASDAPVPKTASAEDAAVAEASAFKAEMERRRLIAVWNPTEDNVRRYYQFQQVTMQKSGTFADVARRLIWSDPSLDYTLQRPISVAGKSQWADARSRDRDLFFRGVYEQVGIFYVYRGKCAPCRVASPIIRQFGQRYGFSVKAISADGAPNPEFSDWVSDRGQLKAWGITDPVTPAYLIYQAPSTTARPMAIPVSDGRTVELRPCTSPKGCLTYLGAGMLAVEEIADRLFVTLATRPGEDF